MKLHLLWSKRWTTYWEGVDELFGPLFGSSVVDELLEWCGRFVWSTRFWKKFTKIMSSLMKLYVSSTPTHSSDLDSKVFCWGVTHSSTVFNCPLVNKTLVLPSLLFRPQFSISIDGHHTSFSEDFTLSFIVSSCPSVENIHGEEVSELENG